MQHLYCDECNSRFFDEGEEPVNGKNFCSFCRPKIRLCGICNELRVMKHDSPNDIEICLTCRKETQAFPNVWLTLRFKCFERDHFTCRYCGRSPLKNLLVVLNCDHIKPRAKGGLDVLENLVTACSECNRGKMDIMLSNYEQRLVIRRKTVERLNSKSKK